MTTHDTSVARRRVLAGAGIVMGASAIAACSGYGKKESAPASESPGSAQAPAPAGQPSAALAKTSEVPVGSGLIVDDVVLTQPTAGVFKGLSTECTHAGCAVSKIAGGEIVCPCHGSAFGLDGAVVKGPATAPLASVAVTVQGDSIVKG